MGNGPSGYQSRRQTTPRVVLESPASSSTEASRPRVKFANDRSGVNAITVRPQMTDIGQFPSEVYRNGRKLKFYRSQSLRLGQNVDMTESTTSVRSNASGPVDGVWEPTLDPYASSGSSVNRRLESRGAISDNNGDISNNNNSVYRGFQEVDYQYGTIVRNGLTRVDEI